MARSAIPALGISGRGDPGDAAGGFACRYFRRQSLARDRAVFHAQGAPALSPRLPAAVEFHGAKRAHLRARRRRRAGSVVLFARCQSAAGGENCAALFSSPLRARGDGIEPYGIGRDPLSFAPRRQPGADDLRIRARLGIAGGRARFARILSHRTLPALRARKRPPLSAARFSISRIRFAKRA